MKEYNVEIGLISYSNAVLLDSWGEDMDERKKKDPLIVAEEILK